MKLTMIFLLIGLMQLSASVYSQNGKISVVAKEMELSELLWQLQESSGIVFVYKTGDLEGVEKISVNRQDASLTEILDEVLENTNMEYTLKNDVVTIKKVKAPQPVQEEQQKLTVIKGKVTDKSGQPIPGATVMVEGTYIGIATDHNGMFSLKSPNVTGVLTISFVGFKAKKLNFSGDQTLTIKMVESTSDLDEVQVIAYGKSNKREMSGVVSVVKADDLKGIPSPSLSNLLQGRVAGMDVTNVSGAPGGGGTNITIRGYNSLGAEAGRRFSNPLWVIDGVPMTSFTSPVTGTNSLSDINPEMIETIHILKDASATSLYGSRAANGVILVTTKKGKKDQKGKFSVNFSQTYSVLPEFPIMVGGKAERDYRIMSRRLFRRAYLDYGDQSYKYPESHNDAYGTNGQYDSYWGNGSAWNPTDGDALQDSLNTFYNNSTNFFKKLYRTGKVTNANIQTYGGSERMTYSIGAGYYDEEGIVIGSDFNRINLMGNFMVKPIDNLTIGFNNYLSMSDRSRGTRDGGFSSGQDVELVPGKAFELSTLLPYKNDATREAIEKFKTKEEKNTSYRLRSSLSLSYDFGKNVNFSNTVSIDYSQNNRNIYLPAVFDSYGDNQSVGEIARNKVFLNESLLNFKKTFNDVHNLEIMAGLSFQRDEYNYIAGSAKKGPSEFVHYVGGQGWPDVIDRGWGFQAGKNYKSDFSEKKMNSYFGRLNYDFNKKYFFTATFRRDGSSVFGENLKWASFPSLAGSWNISEEDFMKSVEFLDFAKMRASWGMSGNVFKNPYLSYGLLQGGYIYDSSPTIVPNRRDGFYNPDLSWEETRQYDIGIDMNFLNYRLSVTADYYNRYTDKMLNKVALPGNYTGYSQQWKNAAAIENQGLELEVKYDIIRKEDKFWRISFNVAKNWNKLADSWNGKDFIYTDENNHSKHFVLGQKVNGIYAWKTDGYWQGSAEETAYFDSRGRLRYFGPWGDNYYYAGTTKFVDVNGDYELNYKDMVYVGSSLPEITGGIVNEVRWKNFDLNMLFSFSLGRDMINAQPISSLGRTEALYPVFVDLNKATFWQNPGDNSDYAVGHLSNYNRDWSPIQDKLVETVNYLKLKTITLGYTLPKSLLGMKYFDEVRVFFSGENLLTWTNYSGIDPETVDLNMGIDDGKTYPLARKLSLGITFKL